jgi:Tfp pilus assembly protein FimT
LIELMVVVAIIGLVGLVTVPSYLGRLPQRQLSEATWRVYVDLLHAKSKAVSENVPVQMSYVAADKKYTIWTDLDQDGTRDTGEEEVVVIDDIPTLTFAVYPTQATFQPTGTMESGTSYHYVRLGVHGGGYKYIYVFPNGHIDPYRVQAM